MARGRGGVSRPLLVRCGERWLLEEKLEVDLVAFVGSSAGEAGPEVLGQQEAPFAYEGGGDRAYDEAKAQAEEADEDVVACGRLRGYGDADRRAFLVAYIEGAVFCLDLHRFYPSRRCACDTSLLRTSYSILPGGC